MTATLTPAELKVTLNGLGLSPSWFADRMGVTMRTVVRWFDGDRIPEAVHTELNLLCERTYDQMRAMVDAVEPDEDGVIVLKTYRTDRDGDARDWPASWHRMMVFRLIEHFRAQGNQVIVEYQ